MTVYGVRRIIHFLLLFFQKEFDQLYTCYYRGSYQLLVHLTSVYIHWSSSSGDWIERANTFMHNSNCTLLGVGAEPEYTLEAWKCTVNLVGPGSGTLLAKHRIKASVPQWWWGIWLKTSLTCLNKEVEGKSLLLARLYERNNRAKSDFKRSPPPLPGAHLTWYGTNGAHFEKGSPWTLQASVSRPHTRTKTCITNTNFANPTAQTLILPANVTP